MFVEQLAFLAPHFTIICLHCFDHAGFETWIIFLSEPEYLVEVEYDDIGDEVNGDH